MQDDEINILPRFSPATQFEWLQKNYLEIKPLKELRN